jgi:hypothetical protein
MVDSQPTSFIGSTAENIMNSEGPLYYAGEVDGGLYYNAEDDSISYIFPWDNSLDVPTPAPVPPTDPAAVVDDTAVTGVIETAPDPNKYPLRADAKCIAVTMKIRDYVPKVSGDIKVEDLMSGISIEKYKVEKSETDGRFHLYYSKNKLSFDYTLKDKSTANAEGLLFVKQK